MALHFENQVQKLEKLGRLCHTLQEALIAFDDVDDLLADSPLLPEVGVQRAELDDYSGFLRRLVDRANDLKADHGQELVRLYQRATDPPPVKAPPVKAPPPKTSLVFRGDNPPGEASAEAVSAPASEASTENAFSFRDLEKAWERAEASLGRD